MIIKIDKTNKIIACYYNEVAEKFPADDVTFFEVDSVPDSEVNTELCFNPETKEFYTKEIDPEILAKRQAKRDAQAKKSAATKWLSDNDWKVNKRLLGEWAEDDERWLEYLDGRAKARADYDDAEKVLNS